MLPIIKQIKLPENNFPTLWQTVVFRNYGMVSNSRIASVLGCSEAVVEKEANRLGLKFVKYNENWEKLGYITIIRNNWYLMPYNQLCKLLDFSEQKLEFVLENDDFLSVKLGDFKPDVYAVKYSPLTKEEKEKTEEIAKVVLQNFNNRQIEPFQFFKHNEKKFGSLTNLRGNRMVHGYLTPCGDVFSNDCDYYMSDELLGEYAQKGINCVWVHCLLSTISPYPFCPEISADYQVRRKALQKLIDKSAKYGIKVYLYFNEPRGLSVDKLGEFKRLAGRVENGVASLCFEHKEVQDYLYTAVKDLFSCVKGLGGCFTITMSENPTHCHYKPGNNCPICKDIPPEEVTARVNNVIAKGIRDSGANAEMIANLWGWSPFMGWTIDDALRGVDALADDVSVMSVSEYDLDIEKGGVKSRIIDYSISNPGPGEIARRILTYAKQKGHKTYAKIQVNNSWECSAVPYLPVFDLTYEHLKNLNEIGVENYMLTWTLGGYPSPTMDMIARYSKEREKFNLEDWYLQYFGENGKDVSLAVKEICKAFKEYPFSIHNLYFSPKSLGSANLWDIERSDNISTMVCYSFDDYQNWINPYPYEVYVSQYKKLLTGWEKGIAILQKINDNQLIDELLTCAEVAYCHFYSDLLQTEYSYLKTSDNKDEINKIIDKDNEMTKKMISLLSKSPFIGFETSNHYFYSERNFLEKLINLKRIRR